MSKQVKTIAGCLLPSGERLGLRCVEDRIGAALLSSHVELHKGDEVLATGPIDIEARLQHMDMGAGDRRWLRKHLRSAVRP